MIIYLDNNATTQPDGDALDSTIKLLLLENCYGNPSSSHQYGERAKEAIEEARAAVAKSINAKPHEIVFTSGGTESNNLALNGKYVICSNMDHSSVFELGANIFGAHSDGQIAMEDLGADLDVWCGPYDTRVLALTLANNETGVIQPVQQVAELGRRRGAKSHVDAVAAYGKIPIDVQQLECDTLAISAHKIHGPKGVGALYVREGTQINPIFLGGSQERGIRPGTENLFGVVMFGKVAQQMDISDHKQNLRDRFEDSLKDVSYVNGSAPRVWNVSNLYFPKVKSQELMLHLLDERGLIASAGSACASGFSRPSRVLTSMFGADAPQTMGSLRFSFSAFSLPRHVDAAVQIIRDVLEHL